MRALVIKSAFGVLTGLELIEQNYHTRTGVGTYSGFHILALGFLGSERGSGLCAHSLGVTSPEDLNQSRKACNFSPLVEPRVWEIRFCMR